MQCSNCGTENRADVRFCRKCGQPLAGGAAVSGTTAAGAPASGGAVSGMVCSSCGATVKIGGRFCPRCGGTLGAAASPGPPAVASAPPRFEASPRPEMPSAPAHPASPPPSKGRKLPRWLWFALGGLALLLLLGLGGAAFLWFGRDKAAPDGATPSPTLTTTLPVVAEAPTSTLTPLPPQPSPTPTLTATATITSPQSADAFDARVELEASTKTVRIGEPVVFTITLVNTGETTLARLRYTLEGQWEEVLVSPEAVGTLVMEQAGPLDPGAQQVVIFRLEGKKVGGARVWAGVTFEVQMTPPHLHRRTSSEVIILVGP